MDYLSKLRNFLGMKPQQPAQNFGNRMINSIGQSRPNIPQQPIQLPKFQMPSIQLNNQPINSLGQSRPNIVRPTLGNEFARRVATNRPFAEDIAQKINNRVNTQIDRFPVNPVSPVNLFKPALKMGVAGITDTVTGASALRGLETLTSPQRRAQVRKGGLQEKVGAFGDVTGLVPVTPDLGVAPMIAGAGLIAGPKAKGFARAAGKFSSLADKKMRFEIPDNAMLVKRSALNKLSNGGLLRLDEVIDHKELFDNYPQLKNVLVDAKELLGAGEQYGNRISLDLNKLATNKQIKDILLHETQHAIQNVEGFAKGAPIDSLGYSRNAGEIEADAVARRRIFTPKQRATIDPYYGSPFKPSEMSVHFGGVSAGGKVPKQPIGEAMTPKIQPNQVENLESIQPQQPGKAFPSRGEVPSQDTLLSDSRQLQQPQQVKELPEVPKQTNGSGQSPVSPPSGEIVADSKYAFNVNKNSLDLDQEGKKTLDSAVNAIKPELEKIKGKKLSFDEVKEEAKTAQFLNKAVGRESTANFEASLLATRERMTQLDAEISRLTQSGDMEGAKRLSQELIDLIKVNSSNAADIGRKLGSFRIMAEERPFRERVLEEIIRTGKLSDDVAADLTKRAAEIDWNDAREVTKFFREFIKPSKAKILEEYRYLNLLSSPKTHITNIFSNAIQAGVTRPATKLASGIVDPIASALTGKQREFYLSEVPVYYRGMLANIPKAIDGFYDVMSGKTPIRNLDMKSLQSGTALSNYNVVSKALSGMDEFFQTIITGGEKEAFAHKFAKSGKQVSDMDIEALAKQQSQYSVFRSPLDTSNASGQGSVLSWVDKGTEAVLKFRQVPGVGWFIPFVQTPMNIFKQGIEYSPLGVATLKGSSNKVEQTAKALVGSTVFAGAGYLAMQDRLSWDTPKDQEQRKLFYAAGMQPYSMKIGDKWISYSRLGPLAYPMALAAAIKYSFKDDPDAVANGQIDKLSNSLTGILGFFGDQSYLQGIGNLVKVAQGEEGYSKATATLGNIATQYVPLSSLQRWVTSVIDPVYRKSDGVIDQVKKGIPGLSTQVGYYEDPFGEPSMRQYPGLNSVSPFNITKEKPEYKDMFKTRQEELQTNSQIRFEEKKLEKEMKEGKSGLEAEASGGFTKILGKVEKQEKELPTSTKTTSTKSGARLEAEDSIAKKKAKLKGEIIEQNGRIYIPSGDSVTVIDTNPPKKKATGIDAFNIDNNNLKNARKVYEVEQLTDEKKSELYKKFGYTKEEMDYDHMSSGTFSASERANFIESKNLDHDKLIDELTKGRRLSIGDNLFASDSLLTELADRSLITKAEAKYLKKLDLDKDGKPKGIQTGTTAKKVTFPTIKAPQYSKLGSSRSKKSVFKAAKPAKPTIDKIVFKKKKKRSL